MQTFIESQLPKKSPWVYILNDYLHGIWVWSSLILIIFNIVCSFSRSVKVSQELVGLALGRNGSNIQKAKNIPGIDKIDGEDSTGYYEFTVFGQASRQFHSLIHYEEVKVVHLIPNILDSLMLIDWRSGSRCNTNAGVTQRYIIQGRSN